MRRFFIQTMLPFFFCVVPFLAAAMVAAAMPQAAMKFYVDHLSPLDGLILVLGSLLFLIQMRLCWKALRWRGTGFDERPDRWINNLSQAAEWFPMLGLLGTVAGILQTFSTITGQVSQQLIVQRYAPAITATGSGLFMALVNILPAWMVLLGRDMIISLSGGRPDSTGEAP